MSIFKILFLVGVLAYAHKDDDTVIMCELALEQLENSVTIPPTLFFRVKPDSVEGKENVGPLITATYLGSGKAVMDRNYQDTTLQENFIHGLSGKEPKQKWTSYAITRLGVKGKKPNDLGIFIQDGISANDITPATLAFDGMNDDAIKEKLENPNSVLVAASFFLSTSDREIVGRVVYMHKELTNIIKEAQTNKYTATADGIWTQVLTSAPVYLVVQLKDEKIELQLAGVVTKITEEGEPRSIYSKQIQFVAGVAFNNLVKSV